MITEELPSEINVTIADKGASLMRFLRQRKLHPLHIDFSSYDNGMMSSRMQLNNSEVTRMIQKQLDASTHIKGIRPDTLVFFYNRGQYARLPVCMRGVVTTTSQSYLLNIQTKPDSIIVYAPASVIDTMKCAYTLPIDMRDLTHTATCMAQFRKIPGVKYVPEETRVTANVDYYIDKEITVALQGLNFPANKRLRTFPQEAKIKFRVGASRSHSLSTDSFVLAPTYEELLNNVSEKYRLHLRSVPNGVSNVRITPAEVDYLIENLKEEEEEE